MKAVTGLFVSMGLLGIVLYVGVILGLLATTVYGLYLAFSASILLGVIVMFVQPTPFLIGIVMLCFHKNLAQMAIDFLTK